MEKSTIYVRLDTNDWNTLNLFNLCKLFYSDGFHTFGGFYLIQLVDEYDGEGVAKLELIRVNQI
jgi:hypothetical protein